MTDRHQRPTGTAPAAPTDAPAQPLPRTTFDVPAEDVIEWRRHLHKHPELSFREYGTADFIEGLLHEWGIETKRLTPTSVIGTITGTAGDPDTGRTIGYRADIDALPIKEETGLHFASQNAGVMHACGHDVHTAMLLGTAKVLQENLDRLHGRVLLIFQHAEEMLPGGARELVAHGAADDLDEVYAFHVAPHPVGHVGICRGRVSTMSGIVSIAIRGQGGHSSNPQLSIDPVLIAAEATMALNTIVSRNLNPNHMNIVNVGSMHGGEAGNVIPDESWLEVSIRSVDEKDWESICERIERLVTGIASAHGATARFEWQVPYPMVVNADVAVDRAWHAAVTALGEERVFAADPWAPSDDFSYFSREAPGCYMFLGGGGAEVGMPFFLHNSKFDVVERAMVSGVKVEVQIALDALAPGLPHPPRMPEDTDRVMPAAGTLPHRPGQPGLGPPPSVAGKRAPRAARDAGTIDDEMAAMNAANADPADAAGPDTARRDAARRDAARRDGESAGHAAESAADGND